MSASGKGRRDTVLVAVLLVGQMALMSGSARGRPAAARIERLVVQISSPVVTVAGAVGGAAGGAVSAVGELLAARERANAYEAEARRLAEELRGLREAEAENLRLRKLLTMRELEVPASIGATVVTANQEGPTRMIVIDRGSRDGVVAELPVVAWGGAVGRVLLAGRGNAKVRLLTDANSGVGGLVQRSRVGGIVVGRSGELLELERVPRFADVVEGDRVVTSGQDGIFPRGFGIGVVRAVREEADGTQTIEVVPELDYARLEEVLVVLEPPAREAAEDELAPGEPF